jgi:hypothetical protein
MKEIKLTQDLIALVDDEDFNLINQHKWRGLVSPNGNTFYAVRKITLGYKKYSTELMHRIILKAGIKELIDHRDGNGLNNQKSNLRLCTHRQNMRNQKPRKGGKSRFKGVSYQSQSNKWRSGIFVEGKQKSLGCYDKEEDAALAYNKAAIEFFGSFAYLNDLNL